MHLFTRAFWFDAVERAVKTAAQTTLTGLALSDVGPINGFDLDWTLAGGFAVGGAVFSVLTSVATAQVRSTATASAVLPPPPPGAP